MNPLHNVSRLEYFIAVAEARSLNEAARRVHLSQPALTKSIQKLEAELDVQLFDRRGHMELTPLGREFLARARRTVAEFGDLQREMELLKGMHKGELKVGCGPLFGEALMGPAVARLIATHPGIKIGLQVGPFEVFPTLLRERRLDFFVADITHLERSGDLAMRPIPPMELVWFARPDHPLAGRRRVTPEAFFSYPLAIPAAPVWGQAWLDKHAPAHLLPFRPAVECSHYPMLRQIVKGSDAISTCVASPLADDVRAGRIALLDVDLAKAYSRAGIVTLRHRSLSPAAKALIAELETEIRGLPDLVTALARPARKGGRPVRRRAA